MDENWKRIDTKTNKILLKINENDVLNSKWENNEYEMKQDGFTKRYNDYNNINEYQYWIDKDEINEENGINDFNIKCKKWNIEQYKEKNIYLNINDNIDFENFDFIQDEFFNHEWNNYLFTYKNKNTYIKLEDINIDVNMDNFNNKYIEINENNQNFDNFMKKLENRIIKIKNEKDDNCNIGTEYEYKYYKNNNGDYKFKIKRDNIEIKQYKNVTVYIKCNRLWKLNYQKQGNDIYHWGVSLIVDKIC
jgi:hypothetical protein